MKAIDNRGFTLVEFVIAIVFIGVVLGPFLLFVGRIHDLNNAVGQQARRESSRSFSDQALALGVDPSLASGLEAGRNPAMPTMAAPTVIHAPAAAVPGMAQLVPLHLVLDQSVAEPRAIGAGYQLGPGVAVAPRSTPTSPLLPIVLPSPVVTPSDGAVLTTDTLSAAAAGQPWTIDVRAVSIAGASVTLAFNEPYATATGLGFAQRTVTSLELLKLVNGTAWAEYSGAPANGDRSVILGDGRTRWFVTRSDRRLQIYEPSPSAHFAYRIGLGAPVIVRGEVELATGSSVDFDYASYQQVQSAAVPVRIDFPAAVKLAFGRGWTSESIGYQWTFHDFAGPFGGDLASFFQPDTLSAWADSIAVSAIPVVPRGAVADNGSWTFTRVKTALGVPVLSTVADGAGFYVAGQLQFNAPPGPDGTPIGRLSFQNGANVSTGPSITIAVAP